MSDSSKINPNHLHRTAVVYVRQSTSTQVEHNRESTERQYALRDKACALGWSQEQVSIIDDDLGLSGASTSERSGFAHLTTEVAMARVGIVLGLEVSRLARNNADWYQLLDLCAMTDTLIGDSDGIYHPAQFNDRLVLGLKGTMSEAELHIMRARLDGGIRNKAARGELRRGLPTGLVWGDEDGEVLMHPDEAVTSAIRTVFERFDEFGSVRRVWLWFRSEGLNFPLQSIQLREIQWVAPSYHSIHSVLTNPSYAGAYVYGKNRHERYIDEQGRIKKRVRKLPQSEWSVLIHEHHEGYTNWDTYEANQIRIASNTHPTPHQGGGGAVREGAALLQGLATCGHCGRKLRTHYRGKNPTPGYHCAGKTIVNGRGVYCLNIGGVQIDKALTDAFIAALEPAGVKAAMSAAEQLESNHDVALSQWRLALERARYEAERAERRYRAVEPENRLVARGLEAQWEQRLGELEHAQTELRRREAQRPTTLSADERRAVLALGTDLKRVWSAPTTTARDKKELLRSLLEEVIISVYRDEYRAHLSLRWRGELLTEIDVDLPRSRPATVRTDEKTVELVRRLAAHYCDDVIAGILNRQGRSTARGLRFTAGLVGNLRRHWDIARFDLSANPPPDEELVNITQAAKLLGIAPSTIHRWLNDGFIAGEQITPGAPWQIRLTDELRNRFVDETPEGYVTMQEATKILGVSRQTVLQRVKVGELDAVHVYRGKRKGLRINVLNNQTDLFNQTT
jgi:DNA invertase Pin-like site-specific DNA recombinase